MTARESLKIDLSIGFEHLPAAPIVEAVIHWSARAETKWDPSVLRDELSRQLPDYPEIQPQHTIRIDLEGALSEKPNAPMAQRRSGWCGYRLSTADRTQIAQFNRDGLVFSRLRPYPNWEAFEQEARRLWQVYVEVASPSQVQRLGVRFINRIALAGTDEINEILRDPPTRPVNLPLASFLYQSRFDVPGECLSVDIVKALQRQNSPNASELGLIIDIDVFRNTSFDCGDAQLDELLPRMRWIKNAAFFGLLNESALQPLREPLP